MRILHIPGINMHTLNGPSCTNLREAFKEVFPDATFVVEGEIKCRFFDYPRLRRLAQRIVEKYDTGEDMLLVGGSAGGIVALLVASLVRRSRVIGIVTLFAPHRFLWGVYPWLLGVPSTLSTPIITFQIAPDRLVWWGTRHLQSRSHSVFHSRVPHAHKHALAREPHWAREIARHTKKMFFPSA